MNVLSISTPTVDRPGFLPPMGGLVRFCFLGDGIVALVALLGFVLGGSEGTSTLIKVGQESNLPTWYSSSQFLVVGLVLAALPLRDLDRHRPGTWALALVPLLFVFLSLDETAMIHERLGDWLEGETGIGASMRTGPWMLVFIPLIGVFGLFALRALWPYLHGRTDVLALFGLGVLVLGVSAVGFEVLANFVPSGSLAQKGLGFAEEVGEMVATTCMLWGAVLLVAYEGIRLEWRTSAP